MSDRAADHLWGFLHALRGAGLLVGPPLHRDFFRALADLPPRDLAGLYWRARLTLLKDAADRPAFDAVFDAWFGGGPDVWPVPPPPEQEDGDVRAPGGGRTESPPGEAALADGLLAGELHVVGGRGFAVDDRDTRLEPLRRAWAERLPAVRSRRWRPVRGGRAGRRLDLRATLRGEPRDGRLRWRARPPRVRRLLLLIDVSGSLKQHTPALLATAHAAARAAPGRVEVFTFGTGLTRVTGPLSGPRLDRSLAAVSRAVPYADGGTAIGAALDAFLGTPRFLSLARGALVIVISDGLERGDCTAMARGVGRLSRLAYRLLWWSPLACSPSYRPVTRGMAAIHGHLDHLGGVRDLDTALAEVRRIPTILAGGRAP